MKNLASKDEDFLDSLPNRAKKRDGDKTHYGDDFPWGHAYRFIESRVGELWDDVLSEFVHADWVPARHRHPGKLSEHSRVHTNTFLNDDGDVCYYDWLGWRSQRETRIVDSTRLVFYVHPETKILCSFTPKKQPSRATQIKRHNAQYMKSLGIFHQLLKINGIWYEVKGKISSLWAYDSWYRDRTENDPLIDNEDIQQFGYSYRPPKPVTITSKKELSHKALKKHGLENGPFDKGPRCKKCGGFQCIHYYAALHSPDHIRPIRA